MLTVRRWRSRRRPGFTLVELLVAIVLLGIVAGGIMRIIVRQQQFYTGSAGVLETRGSVRDGIASLVSDLRSLSPESGDIYAMGRTFLEFRLVTGASTVCTIGVGRTSVTVPPLSLTSRSPLTSWISAPQSGDSLLVYDPGSNPGTSDDQWEPNVLTAAATSGGVCPTTSGFTTTAGEASSGWTISFQTALTSTVAAGSALRFFRRARYELYHASDGNWYLGYYDCLPTRSPQCATIEPVSGPYLPAANTGPSGLELAYYDSTGAVTATPADVRRIDVVVRAQSSSVVHMPGRAAGYYEDSLATSVAVRN